jgi:hypothetical protein
MAKKQQEVKAKVSKRTAGSRKAVKDPQENIQQHGDMIAKAAYYKAEKRGFIPGFEMQDWLEAEMMVMEHRHGARRRALSLVDIQYRRGHGSGLMYNIGPDGMYVLSKAGLRVHDSVDISLAPPKNKGSPVRIKGMVVHRSKYGFGLMFSRLDKNARKLVGKYLSRFRTFN